VLVGKAMSSLYEFYNKRYCPAKVAGHFIKDEYQFYFKSTKSKLRYCVEGIYHEENFFALKYYCKTHKLSKNKYSIHTNTFEANKIIDSCLQAIPLLIDIHPDCSFVAVGARSIKSESAEPAQNNRRYKIYCQKLMNIFGSNNDYVMIMLPDISGMALIYVKDLDFSTLRTRRRAIRQRIAKIKKVVLDCYEDIQILEI